MSQFDGRWRITWMEEWDPDYIDMMEPGHFVLEGNDGYFVFGAVYVQIDARPCSSGTRLEFSWEGHCEGDGMSGRGWLEMKDVGIAEGRVFIHLGDASGIKIEKT